MRILIYDSDLESMIVVADYLEALGYDIVCCDNAELLCDFIRLNVINLMVITVIDEDEIEIIRALKSSQDTGTIKIIAITEEFEKVSLKINYIADEILDKEIDLAKLNHAIISLTYES